MKQNLSGGAIAIVVIVALAIIGFFGYRYISGGPNADVTQQNIAYFHSLTAKNAAQHAMPSTAPFAGGQAGQRPGGAPPIAGGAMPATAPYSGGAPGR